MLTGNLDDLSLIEVMRLMSFARSTGRLEIERSEGTGRVFFREGRVYAAKSGVPDEPLGSRLLRAKAVSQQQLEAALGRQTATGERVGQILVDESLIAPATLSHVVHEQIRDAMTELLRAQDGSFQWAPGAEVKIGMPFPMSIDELLAGGEDRMQRLSLFSGDVPSPEAVPLLARQLPVGTNEVHLSADEWGLLALVNGRRSIEELVKSSGWEELRTLRLLSSLADASLIKIRPPQPDAILRIEDVSPVAEQQPVIRLDPVEAPPRRPFRFGARPARKTPPLPPEGSALPLEVVPDRAGSEEFHVVFICTANRFRSPIAEGFLRDLARDFPVRVTSMGVRPVRIASALPEAIDIAREMDSDITPHRSQVLTEGCLAKADLVIGFERAHVLATVAKGKAANERTFTITEFADLLSRMDSVEGSDPIERAREVVRQAHAKRSIVSWSAVRSEMVDPVGGPISAYRNTAVRLKSLTARMYAALFRGAAEQEKAADN